MIYRSLKCWVVFAACVSASLVAVVQARDEQAESRHENWLAQASQGLDSRATAALAQIAGTDRRLLALRAYLRAGASLMDRWSWSDAQIAAYPRTPEGRAAAADIDAVIAAFAAANPGFTLLANRRPRSLQLQISHWNENKSVGTVAAALVASLDGQFAGHTVNAAALRAALVAWTPNVAATLAAPGLSPHGQARAFDFQIERHGEVVAGTDAASAALNWDGAGWTQKLRTAMNAAHGRLSGPLRMPYEPWHYAYNAQSAPGAD